MPRNAADTARRKAGVAGLGVSKGMHSYRGDTRVIRSSRKGVGLRGLGEASGGSFEFMDSRWTWMNPRVQAFKTHLEEERAAWKPKQVYHVPAEHDFMDLT